VSDADFHIVRARESVEFARYALAGDYTEEAGRSAYMAAYQGLWHSSARVPDNLPGPIAARAASLRASHGGSPASALNRYRFSAGATN